MQHQTESCRVADQREALAAKSRARWERKNHQAAVSAHRRALYSFALSVMDLYHVFGSWAPITALDYRLRFKKDLPETSGLRSWARLLGNLRRYDPPGWTYEESNEWGESTVIKGALRLTSHIADWAEDTLYRIESAREVRNADDLP
jgi:hypothetical protein